MTDDDILHVDGCYSWLMRLVYALALIAVGFVFLTVWAWL